MKKILDIWNKFYTGCVPLKAVLCRVTAALYLGLTVYGGGALADMGLLALVMIFYIALPGLFWTQTAGLGKSYKGLEFGTGLLCGAGYFCLVYCIAMRLQRPVILAAVPLCTSFLYVAGRVKGRKKISLPKMNPDRWLLVLLFFALLLFYTFTTVIKNALPSRVGSTLINQDLLWNVGNANSFKIRFIPEEIRYSGVQLHYHYLTELFAGAISYLSGISAYKLLAFYLAPYLLFGVVGCLYMLGRACFEKREAMLFVYSMFLFGCGSLRGCFLTGRSLFFNDNALHIITNINSQGTAVIFLSIFSAMLFRLLKEGKNLSAVKILLWLAAFFMLSFSKGPVAAVAAIGRVIVIIWQFLAKRRDFKFLAFGLVLGGMFLVIYKTFFSSGANTSMTFSLTATLERTIWAEDMRRLYRQGRIFRLRFLQVGIFLANTLLAAPVQVWLYLVGLRHDLPGLFRLDGKRLWTNSLVVGGIAAFYLFNHYALSQAYFLFLAIFFLNFMAVENLKYIKGKKVLTAVTLFFAGIGFVTQCFMYTNFVGSGGRALVRNLGWDEKPHYACEMTADDELSMEFFRENTDSTALFATNRIHTSVYAKDGISNVYSAFSGRQSYMEGYAYALTNMGVPYYVISQRQAVNDALFSADTGREELKRLCRRAGITHLIYSAQFEGEEGLIADTFEKIYDSPTVRIYATGARPLANHPLYQPELGEYGEGIKE